MNILKSLINCLKKKETIKVLPIVIVPIPQDDIEYEEDIHHGEELLCQSCLEEDAVRCCPNCGCPLCFECYIEHVGNKDKKDLPN